MERRGRLITASAIRQRANTAVLLAPLVILLLVLLVWPLVTLATTSTDGESYYREILFSWSYQRIFLQTAGIAVASTVLALILCIPAAVYLERADGLIPRIIATALSLPLSLPGIVIGFFVILLFGNSGVIPEAIEAATGERSLRIAYTTTGLLLGYLYFQIPRIVLVVRGAAAAVDWEQVDVARTMGASTLGSYRTAVLPALRPAIASASALALATAFGAFGTAATLSRGFDVVPLEIAASFTERFKPELAAALSLILTAVTTTVLVGVSGIGQLPSSKKERT